LKIQSFNNQPIGKVHLNYCNILNAYLCFPPGERANTSCFAGGYLYLTPSGFLEINTFVNIIIVFWTDVVAFHSCPK